MVPSLNLGIISTLDILFFLFFCLLVLSGSGTDNTKLLSARVILIEIKYTISENEGVTNKWYGFPEMRSGSVYETLMF